ncbi:two-component regulator propeller domain-containing protein [uncultured Formosa sp.]|uniref:two-component regulator propeller domain-containing protein n=1 Tax=uncultured Formosa sp. TaxID=255435 RepID=UPI00262E62BA|nr:two-component regulator propeller domain-containing protein [uncultured Formosa sp.]
MTFFDKPLVFAFLLFLSFSSQLSLRAQDLKFKTLTTQDGLSNNSVSDIANDRDGKLWIGTWDGLNVYDGNSFTVYKHEKGNSRSIPANDIDRVHMDPDGTIWILTEQYQLSFYNEDGTFKTLDFKEPILERYFEKNKFPIVRLKSGEYLQLTKFGQETISKKDIPEVENLEKYSAILKGIVSEEDISCFFKDSRGNLWFAVRFKGLYVVPNNSNNIRNEHIEHYTHDSYDPYSFSSNEIDAIYEDVFGNIWLAHKDGGLSKVYQGSNDIKGFYPHPILYPHLPNEAIRAITKDRKNDLWLGYYTQGLFYFDESEGCFVEFVIDKAKDNLDWKRIRSLFTDSEGGVWVGTYAGLIRVYNGTTTYYSSQVYEGLPNNRIYALTEDTNQNIWIGCWGGLAKFNLRTKVFEYFKGKGALNDFHIRKITASKNELVIATEHSGVIFFSLEKGTIVNQLNKKDGLLGDSCYSLITDTQTGFVWVGSLGGITIYNPISKAVVASITEENGLPSHMVYGMFIDKDKVWISTTKGGAAIDMKTYSVHAFDTTEGWRNAEFSEGAAFQDDKGVLFFGGVNGLDYFLPQNMYFSTQLPILKVSIDGDLSNNLVEKNYKDNTIQVQIDAVSYVNNSNNQILYQLEGYDEVWNIYDGNGSIIYKKIPFGTYRLKVKNSMSDTEKSIDILINKPYYLSWQFFILVILIVIGLIIFYTRIKYRKSRKYQQELKKMIAERTIQVEKQKSALEFANRELDQKNNYLEERKRELLELHNALKSSDFEKEKFKAFVLKNFKTPIAHIMEISSSVEETSIAKELKLQSVKLSNLISEWEYLGDVKHLATLEPVAYKLQNLLKPIIEYLEEFTQKREVVLECNTKVTDIWVKINVLAFRFIFKYIFNDVLKYSEKGSTLKVTYHLTEDYLYANIDSNSKLLVSDFSSAVKFSPYYKAVDVLVSQLKGECQVIFSEAISIEIKIPLHIIATETVVNEHIQLEHLDDLILKEGKRAVLVLSDETEETFVSKMLLDEDKYQLVFENEIGALISALKRLKVNLLVIYNHVVSDDLVRFFKQLKKDKKMANIPILFISEQIDYFLQEEILELGVDDFIQFPIGQELIRKKMNKLIELQVKADKQLQLVDASKEELYYNTGEKLAQKAVKLIKEHLSDSTFNIDKMNTLLGVSKIKGYRLFNDVFGQPPLAVLLDLRMQKAEYLLLNTNLNISEIGYECGYNEPKYFSKQFKKRYGCTPSQYRTQNTGETNL